MIVREFLDQFSVEAERIVNDLAEFVDFIRQKNRSHKSMREANSHKQNVSVVDRVRPI